MNRQYLEQQLKLNVNYPRYCEYLITVWELIERKRHAR